MAIRVALIGTGNVGKPALVQLINDSRFELTGVWVSSEAKAGKDAAELAGLDGSTGITATNDLDAVLATNPECAVYTALADNRLPEALEDYRRILSAGVNVVGSSAGVPAVSVAGHSRGAAQADRGRRTGRQVEPVRQRHRSRLRQRPCCRLPLRARARASSRSGAWRSSTTTPTTART